MSIELVAMIVGLADSSSKWRGSELSAPSSDRRRLLIWRLDVADSKWNCVPLFVSFFQFFDAVLSTFARSFFVVTLSDPDQTAGNIPARNFTTSAPEVVRSRSTLPAELLSARQSLLAYENRNFAQNTERKGFTIC